MFRLAHANKVMCNTVHKVDCEIYGDAATNAGVEELESMFLPFDVAIERTNHFFLVVCHKKKKTV